MEIKANITIIFPEGEKLSLTEEEARLLYMKLSEFFGNNTQYLPVYIEKEIVDPWKSPYGPIITWGDNTGMTSDEVTCQSENLQLDLIT